MSYKKITCVFVLVALVSSNGYGAIIQEKAIETEPIDSGFFFWDGKYIEAPYVIENRNNAVFINGFRITPYPYKRPDLNITEDPGFPPGVTRKTSLDDLRAIKWKGKMPHTSAKFHYLWRTYSKEQAQEKMMDYYRSLPCIKEAMRVRGDGVRLTDYKGNSIVRDLYISGRFLQSPATDEELKKLVDQSAALYRERFQKDDCYLFFMNASAELSTTGRNAVNILREMRDVLLDNTKDKQIKVNELLSLNLIPPHNPELAEMIALNFEQNNQFNERLKALEQKMITAYGPEAIHPVERDVAIKSVQEKEEALRKMEQQR